MKHIFARHLRRNQTDVERKLWQALRDRRFARVKFRRQQPIGSCIVDFVCFETKLVIELDGSQHGAAANMVSDKQRTVFLQSRGFRVKRFGNHELIEHFDAVLDAIAHELAAAPPHQQSLST